MVVLLDVIGSEKLSPKKRQRFRDGATQRPADEQGCEARELALPTSPTKGSGIAVSLPQALVSTPCGLLSPMTSPEEVDTSSQEMAELRQAVEVRSGAWWLVAALASDEEPEWSSEPEKQPRRYSAAQEPASVQSCCDERNAATILPL